MEYVEMEVPINGYCREGGSGQEILPTYFGHLCHSVVVGWLGENNVGTFRKDGGSRMCTYSTTVQ